MNTLRFSAVSAAVIVVAAALFIFPGRSLALGKEADAMCTPVKQECACGMVMGPKGCTGGANKFMCPCWDTTAGFKTTGVCVAEQKCEAKATGGLNGMGLDQVAKILGDLMSKLMQQKGGGSGADATPPSANQNPSYPPTCTITSSTVSTDASSTTATLNWSSSYDVTSASISPNLGQVQPNGSQTVTASTSVSYTMTVTGPGGTSNCYATLIGGSGTGNGTDLSNLLFGTTGSTSTTDTSNTNTDTTGTITNVASTTSLTPVDQSQPVTLNPFTNPAYLLPGLRGDIKVLNNGATIVAGNRNQTTNSEVAGFYGSNTFSGQPTGLVANLCQNRPWASNFLSYVIPPTFFDGLCSLRGYTVGLPQQAPTVTVTQTAPQTTTTSTTTQKPATSTVQTIPARVRIWAAPATVPLGSRTSIFWTSQGVTDCKETSPDGSFSQNTLSGGASTVPLTGATTYTISCVDMSGNPVTSEVTVRMAI